MPSLRCEYCGRRTIIRTIFERSLTETANSEVRVCPEHGQAWQKQPDDQR